MVIACSESEWGALRGAVLVALGGRGRALSQADGAAEGREVLRSTGDVGSSTR